MDPKSTAESALVCSLDLGSPFSCSRIIADLFQVYVFGAASVILCFSYYIIFEFCNYFSKICKNWDNKLLSNLDLGQDLYF